MPMLGMNLLAIKPKLELTSNPDAAETEGFGSIGLDVHDFLELALNGSYNRVHFLFRWMVLVFDLDNMGATARAVLRNALVEVSNENRSRSRNRRGFLFRLLLIDAPAVNIYVHGDLNGNHGEPVKV